ncbi:MAG TPA: hypothetical protein VFH17_04960, partial [Coriobacteriia bacterium]|nr:hypothetical protein [Coriobacteriia bacterium]
VLGTPAYTVFAGELGAVDAELVRRGLLTRVGAPEEVRLERKGQGRGGWLVENRSHILAEITRVARTGSEDRGTIAEGVDRRGA